MTYSSSAQQIISKAERRWERTIATRPDIEPAVVLQRRLVTRTLALAELVDRDQPASVHLDTRGLTAKLKSGMPALAGEQIDVNGGPLKAFAVGFCEDLATGEAGGPSGRLGHTLADGVIDVGSLVEASLGRRQDAIRTKAHQVGVAPDLLWLVAELTSAPVANRLQRVVATDHARRSRAFQAALHEWSHGFCWVCGSWPAFSERIADKPSDRSLRCSYCGSSWTHTADLCIYCRANGDSLLTAAFDPQQPSRRVELCRECSGYLKCIDLAEPTEFEVLAVEDLDTTDLDIGAVERGYARGPMHTFDTSRGAPCPPPADT